MKSRSRCYTLSYPGRGSREPCGLKFPGLCQLAEYPRRGSREPCGLKSGDRCIPRPSWPSRLARALWIEIYHHPSLVDCMWSRLARALWIEIGKNPYAHPSGYRRGSREPCGLKFCGPLHGSPSLPSRLARALWIEISTVSRQPQQNQRRGSREPCGLKCRFPYYPESWRPVEARESLVD